MTYERIGQPCRNFNILGSTIIVDPADGREKVVLSNFAAGATGNLILLDPESGEGEPIPLPGDEGAWAVLNLDDETLLVGTCPRYGYLHSLDLATRTWAAPLRDEGETYIWNLCRGSDGLVYGGTYPGCVLLRYDPARQRLENLGRMSENPDNLYSRYVYALPGHILVACGMAEMHLTLWDIERGQRRRFGRPGAQVRAVTDTFICTETDGQLNFYDTVTFEPMAARTDQLPVEPTLPYSGVRHVLTLQDGRLFAVRGQEYFVTDGTEAQPPLRPIPTPRPPTRIHTITAAPDGKIWGSSGFGQTIFSYDPASGEHWNSSAVCDQGGEVYGMAFAGDRLFLSAYSGGDHAVYDPSQPWDQVNNRNPRTLEAAGPALIRPEARSIIGPDGHFWTGWMARYGVYGGGISRINVETLAVTVWSDPVPSQTLTGLTADDRYLYFTTGGAGNGLPDKVESFHFVVWDPAGEIVWQQAFPTGQRLGPLAAVNGRVLVVVGTAVQIFNPNGMIWEKTVALDQTCQCLLALDGQHGLLFCGDNAWAVDARTGTKSHVCNLPGPARTATCTAEGTLYFAQGTELYRLQEKASSQGQTKEKCT